MKIVTSGQMKEMESVSNSLGVTYYDMMVAAGVGVADYIDRTVGAAGRNCLVFCGKGNNGGDGIVAARRLKQLGGAVAVIMTDGDLRSDEAKAMYAAALAENVPIGRWQGQEEKVEVLCSKADIIIDAIYGTGFSGALDDTHRSICRTINNSVCAIFSIDIPSGVIADNASADADSVKADFTLALHARKPAHIAYPAVEFCGEVSVLDIGLPPEAEQEFRQTHFVTDEEYIMSAMPQRVKNSYKGDYGRLFNISGCSLYMGAPALSTLAAMRSGTGYVTLASTGEVCRTVMPSVMECVFCPLPPAPSGCISSTALPVIVEKAAESSAVLIGCGLSLTTDTVEIVKELIRNCPVPIIIDADGINAIEGCIDILKEAKNQIILTPHIGELARLMGISASQAIWSRGELAEKIADIYGVTVLVKGPVTTIHTPEGITYYNTTGNPGLAKAGSGDVLSGIIAGLAAQGIKAWEAAVCGAWLHGTAADFAADIYSHRAMLPRDVIGSLGGVFASKGL